MPEAPEIFRLQHPECADIERHKAADAEQGQRGGGGLYQSYRYRKFRGHVKRQQRAVDEERVHDIYNALEERSFGDYLHWMKQDNPLCVECLEQGMIKPGRVMDHVQPIEQGGSPWAKDNLQWLCDYCHQKKRATTDKEKI